VTGSSIAGIITATATVLTALGGLILALAVFLPTMRKTRELAERNQVTLDEVHVIVNQQRTDMQRYQRALIDALHKAGVDVPIDQSVDLSEPNTA
jgi:hypothetical protein